MTSRALVFGLAALLLPGCAQMGDILSGMDKPRLTVEAVRLSDLSLTDVSLEFDVGIHNPYSAALPVTKAAFSLASGGTTFLSGKSDRQGLIGAGKMEIYPVVAQVPFVDLLQVLSGVKPGAIVPYVAKLDLSVDAPVVGLLTLPIQKSGDLPVPAVPDVSLAKFEVANASLSEVSAILDLQIGNTNSFPLDLSSGRFQVKLAGVDVGGAALDRALSLASNGKGGLRIPIRFSPMSVGVAAFRAVTGGDVGYSLDGALTGSTKWGPIDLPFTSKGNAPVGR